MLDWKSEISIDEIFVALCYDFGMVKEKDILISELKLSDLKELAETYLKLTKSENITIKKKSEKLLIEVLGFMEKAHKDEIMTIAGHNKKVFDLMGGKEKTIETLKKISESKKKYAQRKRVD